MISHHDQTSSHPVERIIYLTDQVKVSVSHFSNRRASCWHPLCERVTWGRRNGRIRANIVEAAMTGHSNENTTDANLSEVRRIADQVIDETHDSASGVSTNAVPGVGSVGQPSISGTNAGESSGSISPGVGQQHAGRGSGGALGGVNRVGVDPEQANAGQVGAAPGSDEATAGMFDPGDVADAKLGYGNTPRGADATSGSTNTGGEPGEIDSVDRVIRSRGNEGQ